jgi:hypothetical protein
VLGGGYVGLEMAQAFRCYRSGFFERACASALVARSAFSEVVRFHDNHNAFLRKGLGQLQFALTPWQILGNQTLYIRIDRESRGIEGRGSKHQQRAGNNDRPPIASAEIGNSNDR